MGCKIVHVFVVCFLGLLLTFACNKVSDGEPDSGSDGDTDADTDTDSDTDTDTDADQRVQQEPMTVRVSNNTDGTIYINQWQGVSFRLLSAETWNNVSFHRPMCTVSCNEVKNPMDCCILCDMVEAVYAIEKGNTRDFPWSGVEYYMTQGSCEQGCQCSEQRNPLRGRYQALVAAGDDVNCWDQSCTPDDDGQIWGASVLNTQEYSVTFDIPSNETLLVISVE